MIAVCPKCQARYQIDDAKVGAQGVNLKCPKCTTVFKVTKTAPAPSAAPVPRPAAPPAAPRPAAPPAAPRPTAPPAPPARPPVPPARPPAPAPRPAAAPAAPRPAAPPPTPARPAPPAAPRPAAPPPTPARPAPPAPRPAAPSAAPRPAAPPTLPARPPAPAPRPAAPSAAPRPAAPLAPPARPVSPAAPRPAAPPAPPARPAPPAAPAPKPAAPAAPAAKQLATGPYKPSIPSVGTVLVADADDAFLKHLARLLLQGGFTVYLAHDGAVAMELIKGKSPQVAIVDVALPKIYGFEVAEMVKQDAALLANTKVVLLGSVYEKDRYRRQPRSYYGADEYLEKHKDGPVIMAKVRKLILGEPEPEPAPAPAAPAPAAARPAPVPAPKPSAPAPAPAAPAPPVAVAPAAPPVLDDPAHQKAARLGRTIISDILLYNPDQVVRGIKEGNIHELLAKDIEDGLKHFNSRVSEDIRSKRDYFKEAFEAMIAKKKAELGIKDR